MSRLRPPPDPNQVCTSNCPLSWARASSGAVVGYAELHLASGDHYGGADHEQIWASGGRQLPIAYASGACRELWHARWVPVGGCLGCRQVPVT